MKEYYVSIYNETKSRNLKTVSILASDMETAKLLAILKKDNVTQDDYDWGSRCCEVWADSDSDKKLQWVIKNAEGGYWSKKDGWTDHQDCATVFSQEEKEMYNYIPGGNGTWIPISEAPELP